MPEEVPCKASDECHGPGTETPPPPNIKSIAGKPEGSTGTKCGKGRVKRKGRCVKSHKSKHRHQKRGKHNTSGGRKMIGARFGTFWLHACCWLPSRLPRLRPARSIETFTTTSSDTTRRAVTRTCRRRSRWRTRREPEAARNVIFNAPRACSEIPTRSSTARHRTSPSNQCPSNSQAGLITVYANYEGDPQLSARHGADLQPRAAGEQTALFAFIVPVLNIPIQIPVAVRTGDRLRAALHGLRTSPRLDPAGGRAT